MATGSSNQMEALQHVNENTAQWKACRCGDGDGSHWPARSDSHDRHVRCHNCQNLQVFKSGPLFISSKGLGWTSWKKRWFILTRASLVFFRSDPNAPAQKGSEVNLTLGGIELNNSGSVVVRADKKLLTVLFPDGRDGRAFTLKAETSEDMHEWKIALEHALSQAPSASLVLGAQSSILHNEVAETIEGSLDKSGKGSKRTTKSTVIGRPVLLALEDTDGNPSFLEKAVKFIEDYGMKVEGILRQSADVEEVERRIEEYEHGKNEFSSDEDAHVIGDCIKYVLRELPSSPVPASCCTALLEAFRGDRGTRVSSMRTVIYETFPEPNRHLLQRMLKMMQIVASHKTENRMSVSAIAACMAPLLLRPLLAGDCELEDEFDMGGDGSIQLLQAAAAANHAQAIVIILLEQYDRIFTDDHLQEDAFSSELYSESECSEDDDDYEDEDEDEDEDDDEDEYEDEESTDSEVQQHNGYHKAESDKKPGTVNGSRNAYSEACDESTTDLSSDLYDNKVIDSNDSDILLPKVVDSEANCRLPDSVTRDSLSRHHKYERTADDAESKLSQDNGNNLFHRKSPSAKESDSCGSLDGIHTSGSSAPKTVDQNPLSYNKAKEFIPNSKRPAVWGRTAARKNLSLEAINYVADDETAVKRLETAKSDLQNKLNREVKENEQLQGSLERRKEALRDRRLALQQDVERLQGQLQKERALRASLEAGLISATPGLPISSVLDNKTRKNLEDIALTEADIISLKQKVSDLQGQLKQDQQISSSQRESIGHYHHSDHQSKRNEGCEDVSIVADPRQREHSRNTEDVFSATTSMDENSQGPDAMSLPTNQPSLAWSSSSSTNESSSNESNANNHQTNSKIEQKQPLRRQLHNVRGTESSSSAIYNSSQDGPADGASGISRKSSCRGEELVPPSSSALTRLTNRLNFLKERRVQLVNELQAVDGNHSQGSKCLPPRTNSR